MSYIHWLVIASAGINIAGTLAYVGNTLKGKTKPNRISWAMWSIGPLVATAAALSADADLWSTTRTFFAGFTPFLVFLASFVNKKSYWKLTRFDAICGLFSLMALVAWLGIDSAKIAIILLIIGDASASLPTLRKAWAFPGTETGLTYFASLVSSILIIPIIPAWNIENAGFQIYLLGMNLILVSTVYHQKIFKGTFKKSYPQAIPIPTPGQSHSKNPKKG